MLKSLHRRCFPEPGPERLLPRHSAGDGSRHPLLLGGSYGDDGPEADGRAALQRGVEIDAARAKIPLGGARDRLE